LAGHPEIARLHEDYRAVEQDYYRKTKLFPIMHAVGIRRDVLDANPWLASSVFKAFAEAKRLADADLAETTALKIGLPWVAAEYEKTCDLMGVDFWPYGIEKNRHTLETMARYSHEQGLATRVLPVDEMFAKGALEATRV
jgi:4,5-dihydroxyphthalate decarboxylase